MLVTGSVGEASCVFEFSTGMFVFSVFNLVTVLLPKYCPAGSKPGFVLVLGSVGDSYVPKIVTLAAVFHTWPWLYWGFMCSQV